jgi:hypothetical protein
MTRGTRAFLFASGLIVVIGLGTGLVAVYSGGLSTSTPQKLSELGYVPADVTVVAYADVRHIMNSEFRQRLRGVLPDSREKDQLLAEIGIDVERDIDTVLAGVGPSEERQGASPLVLLRGRFDAARIEQVAVSRGAAAEDYQGRRLIVGPAARDRTGDGDPEPSPERRQPAIAVLEPGLIGLGSLDALKRAVDTAGSANTVRNNTDLMSAVTEVAASSDAWVAGRADVVSGHEGLPDAVKEPLSSVEWFALSADIDRAVVCRLRAAASDPKAGENLRGMVNGAISMARVMAGKDARLAGVLDSLQASGTGADIELSFTVSPEMLDAMSGAVPPPFAPRAPR